MTDFRGEFVDQLQTGAEALKEAGYDVIAYQTEILSGATAEDVIENGDTPEEALDNALSTMSSEERFFFYIGGDELEEAITGNKDPESLVYRNVKGLVEIDEPAAQPEWSDEEYSAFGTAVRYVPEHPDDHWEVSTAETIDPYDLEDARERAQDIVEALEEYGLEAQIGSLN
jgi:hypothetical protein